MKILVFEDNHVIDLNPITLTRPAFQIPVAGWTLEKFLKMNFPDDEIEFYVRDEMAPFFNYPSINQMDSKNCDILINARSVPSPANIMKIKAGDSHTDLIEYPHQVIIWHKRVCVENLEFMLGTKKWIK